jgi:methionyl-tRNA formyltransferase
MKFIVLGTSKFTIKGAEAILDSGCEICAVISMSKQILPLNSADMKGFALSNKIDYFEVADINDSTSIDLMRKYNADYIFCSWPKMMKRESFSIPKHYTIGTHPTDLPYNRGRHPLHWLIDLGINETQISFFIIDEGVDTGRVLHKVPMQVHPTDTIGDLDERINNLAYEGVRYLCDVLKKDPAYNGVAQDSLGNTWRKKTPHDVTIDLRMTADKILRIVRSFTAPYLCANLIFEENIIKVCEASIVDYGISKQELQRIEPGKILDIEERKIIVKADDSIVKLVTVEKIPERLKTVRYIHPPTKYILEWYVELSPQLI